MDWLGYDEVSEILVSMAI